MSNKNVNLLTTVVDVGSCTASKSALPTQADAESSKQSFPVETLDDLKNGKTLYEANCGLCHKLHAPADFDVNAWHNVVPPMVQKVNENQMKLNENDERLILMYVTSVRK